MTFWPKYGRLGRLQSAAPAPRDPKPAPKATPKKRAPKKKPDAE
jgi:hypothetical protein